MTETAGTVFVISQIGDPGSETRKRADVVCDLILAPVAQEHGLSVVRSDRDITPGQITSQMLRSILDARIVVADLTGRNPNVFYEVAFAQSFGKATILLVNDPQNLPFDTRNERTIPVGDATGEISMAMGEEVKKQLRSAFGVVTAPGYQPESLITEVAGARSLADLAPTNPLAAELASVRDGVDEIRRLVRHQQASRAGNTIPADDFISLREFVELLATSGRLSSADLALLVTASTSSNFDQWVNIRLNSLLQPEQKPRKPDPDEIAF